MHVFSSIYYIEQNDNYNQYSDTSYLKHNLWNIAIDNQVKRTDLSIFINIFRQFYWFFI
jgi:hypothetical protein